MAHLDDLLFVFDDKFFKRCRLLDLPNALRLVGGTTVKKKTREGERKGKNTEQDQSYKLKVYELNCIYH